MNQTYQELLRAELARISAGQAPNGAFPERAVAVAEPPGTPAAAIAHLSPPPGMFTTGTPPEARRTQWRPSMEDLPSLQHKTPAAEQFRRLRSRLLEFRGTQPLKKILISSAVPQEGKSFVAANLAVSLGQHRGSRVLLIDGDLRRYSMQNYFGMPYRPGLPDFLTGKAMPWEIVQKADADTLAKAPRLSNLCVVAGGGADEQVTELSADSRFGELLAFAEPHFDWIVVDSSPVTLVSDAVNMARQCDGVLLVVRAGVTKYQIAQRAQQELQAAPLLGVVLNAVEDKPSPSYYGYGPTGPSEPAVPAEPAA